MPLGSGWFYNDRSGAVISQLPVAGLLEEALHGLGWHGPFATKQDAVNFGNQLAAQGKGKAPAGFAQNVANVGASAVQAAGSTASSALGINFENWLLRLGEVALGIVLVAVGLNALLKNPVGNTVDKLPKVVPV